MGEERGERGEGRGGRGEGRGERGEGRGERGEGSQILCAYSPKVVRTNEIVKSCEPS